jgi:hypothetical protein
MPIYYPPCDVTLTINGVALMPLTSISYSVGRPPRDRRPLSRRRVIGGPRKEA